MTELVDQHGQPISTRIVQERALARRSRGYGGASLTGGGIYNPSGTGTNLDKSEGSFFTPTRMYYRTPLEVLVTESASASRFVKMPVDDWFIRWREFTGDDEGAIDAMTEAEKAYDVRGVLQNAMHAARQYGTGVVVMMIEGAPMEDELNLRHIREGDLKALHYFDRFDLSVTDREYDLMSPNFRQPTHYMVHPVSGSTPIRVHHSRVIRFDGLRPPTRSGFTVYDHDFGVSTLIPVIKSILQDSLLASGVSHMTQEASLPVLHIAGLRDKIAAAGLGAAPGQYTPGEIGSQVREMSSIFRLLMLEKGTEDFSRVQVAFAGIADLFEKYDAKVAQAAGIPLTRWQMISPAGMNSTGESDMRNYVVMAEALREYMMPMSLQNLDAVLARNVGLAEAPEYEWRSLLEMSDQEIAEAALKKAEAAQKAADANFIDEDEGREALSGDAFFGPLEGPAPEPPEPEMPPAGGPGNMPPKQPPKVDE